MIEADAREAGERLRDLVESLELRTIRIIKWSGSLEFEVPLSYDHIRLHAGTPLYRQAGDSFDCRFSQHVELVDSEGDVIASIEVECVAEFDVLDGRAVDMEADATALFVDRNAFFMVWPYVREAVQTMSSKMGLEPVVLGVLLRDQQLPQGVSLLPRVQ